MIERIIIISFVLIQISPAHAQEFSLRVNSLLSSNRQEKIVLEELNGIPQISERFNGFSLDLSYFHPLKSKYKPFIRFGLIHLQNIEDQTSLINNGVDGERLVKVDEKNTTLTFSLGLGKEVVNENGIIIDLGVEIPFRTETASYSQFDSETYDNMNILQGRQKTRFDFVKAREFGLGFNISTQYYFLKQFAFVIDGNFYLLYEISKGEIIESREVFDENNILQDKLEFARNEEIERYKKQNIFSIGLKYRFP